MSGDQVLYPFPRTLNKGAWEDYLGRKITNEEHSLIESAREERNYNLDLDKLYDIARKRGLYIPKLTARNGNCLFESLNILGLCENQGSFRRYLAHMMLVFKDNKNFFKNFNDKRSLGEMFNDTNEIEYVLCNEEFKLYKYTYETMCQDFASGFSWTRLPTQLIIQFISTLMNVRFEIYSNMSEYVNILDFNEEGSNPNIVYLGHLGEKHYVPLDIRVGRAGEEVCPKYNYAKRTFFEWALTMEQSLNSVFMPPNKKETPIKDEEAYVEITAPMTELDNRVEYE
jgi:hypothetical protein